MTARNCAAEQHVERRDEQEVEHQEQDAVHGVLRGDHQHGEPEDERRERVERDRFAHYHITSSDLDDTR